MRHRQAIAHLQRAPGIWTMNRIRTRTMHITHIVESVANEASGPSYSVTRLAEALAARGAAVDLLSTGVPAEAFHNGVRRQVLPPDWPSAPIIGRLSFSRSLRAAIDRSAAGGAVLHGHGLWLMSNIYPGWSAGRHRTPLIVSPRGMLGPAALQFSRKKKLAFWALAQRRALARVNCLHATSHQEHDDIRAFGLSSPIAILPNGIDVPAVNGRDEQRAPEQGTVLYLGRVHPKKGLDRLLLAWARLEAAHPDWRLRIVGPSEGGHGEELRTLAANLGLARVTFEDSLFGAAKRTAYRQADVFVLPTLNENFAMTVAESLAEGTPVISTKGAPWAGLAQNRCGWWIDHGVEPLAAALTEAMALPAAERAAMGTRGRAWMIRDFSWQRIAEDMLQVYGWCAGRNERPDTVMLM